MNCYKILFQGCTFFSEQSLKSQKYQIVKINNRNCSFQKLLLHRKYLFDVSFFICCLDHKTVVYYSAVKTIEIEKMNMLNKLNPEKCQLCKYVNYCLYNSKYL